jgi:hypothetical protein
MIFSLPLSFGVWNECPLQVGCTLHSIRNQCTVSEQCSNNFRFNFGGQIKGVPFFKIVAFLFSWRWKRFSLSTRLLWDILYELFHGGFQHSAPILWNSSTCRCHIILRIGFIFPYHKGNQCNMHKYVAEDQWAVEYNAFTTSQHLAALLICRCYFETFLSNIQSEKLKNFTLKLQRPVDYCI